jgi:uncharacterized protein (UPF0303 family)
MIGKLAKEQKGMGECEMIHNTVSSIDVEPQVTHSGTSLDNDFWVARKRKAVIRFGCSTWQLHNKYSGDEEAFAKKMGLGVTANEVSNDSKNKAVHCAN